ncbi:AAA domain-containing protein [Desulforamulus aquiferis]|uniref:AAA domain-containing protein n=1 Tax=Desulforamulus aquiferis TaxID=1397668 RepID=A0AAW7ZF18_9FIRM|nr:AAA domain-containing protein [Desulforamulus aquiferis]MDO7787365.1 AAA domain-containing protein [Desulforamulus aquiferis]
MNIKEVMVLVKGEDKTEEISNIYYDPEKKKVKITYRKVSTSYPYNQNDVVIINKPKVIEQDVQIAYVDGIPVYKPRLILDFGERIRIIQYNGKSCTVKPQSFSLVKDGAVNQDAQQILTYLREISQYTSDNPEEEAFLKREMEQLTFVHPESVLSRYLNQQGIESRTPNTNSIIFPFRFNLSQKVAVENALTSSISVIEGPPGTGKTQTILNLIANLVAVQGKSVAVVSNNNEAVKNVIEKMAKQGYGFLTALLGKSSNQDIFFANMPVAHVDEWDYEEDKEELIQQIDAWNMKLNQLLKVDRKRVRLCQELRAWGLEQEHFEEYYARQDVEEIGKLPLFRATPDRIVSFLAETSLAKERNQSSKFLYKLKLLFKYGVFDHKKLQQQELSILLSLQREFYRQQIRKVESEIRVLESELDGASFDVLIENHQQYSEKLFRKCLYQSHSGLKEPDFSKKSFKVRFQEFIQTFPIILSTTHALRRSIPQNYLLDYVIIDEASQVDILTGTLAFSCCRNVIIVGDMKQLSQITNEKIEPMVKTSPPNPVYNYFQHNILSSIISIYESSLPRKILQEHYRCHPQIIEFCNKKYYDGELIPYTNTKLAEWPLVLYKTVEGNHMRRVTRGEKKGNYNQRELDVTVEEILKNSALAENRENIGFVTPYRKQANKAGQLLPSGIESDTVHKYQGREKDIMIMSTVLDSTRDGQKGLTFVDDPQMVNVAVSRAIRQFVLVTDRDLFFKRGKDIGDLIRYIQYSTLDENVIDSNIVSVFDLLYRQYASKLIPLKAKMDQSVRYQSEEALRVLLEEILAEPQNNRYSYVYGMLLRNLLNNVALLTPEELNFVNNRASLDFIVYNKQDKACVLVVEVDGFAFHENNPVQKHRDMLKDMILAKYGVPLLRLPTNGSREREKIQKILSEQ